MPKRMTKGRVRAPDRTRARLLVAAFEEMYRHGYQAAGLEAILARAGVTKGALYHHFPDKAALGCAVVDELIRGAVLARWLSRLDRPGTDPITALQRTLRHRAASATADEARLGCPLNNLAQEMSPLDERFRTRINAAFTAWRDGFARALARGRREGVIRGDVSPRKLAAFLVASVEGSYGVAKSGGGRAMLRSSFETLATFLDGLRPPSPARRKPGRRARGVVPVPSR